MASVPTAPATRPLPIAEARSPILIAGLPSGALLRAGLLAALLRGVRGVGDLGGTLLRHPLLAQAFVLLLVLHAGSLAGHEPSFRLGRRARLKGSPSRTPDHIRPRPMS